MTSGPSLRHDALFYAGPADYVDGVGSFLREGLAAGEPALVALPATNLDLLRQGMNGDRARVTFLDMAEVGRNPGRIISAVRAFTDAHDGHATRFVGEPIWAGRSRAEIREATRHEALLNAAFADVTTAILCPYDVTALPATVITEARCTHPHLVSRGTRSVSRDYTDPVAFVRAPDELAPAPRALERLDYDRARLRSVRACVERHAVRAGLDEAHVHDLVLAASEVATNTVVHAATGGTLRVWRSEHELVCELRDGGRIDDPLVGRLGPAVGSAGGRGLWLANQLCDLVEIRSGAPGTTVRLHMRIER